MSVYFANDKIFAESNRIECARAAEASTDKAASLLSKLDGTDTNCQFKVTEGGVYILGNRADAMNACETLFGAKKYVANNDNNGGALAADMKNAFAFAGAKFRLGLDFPMAAAANATRAPQLGMALNAA